MLPAIPEGAPAVTPGGLSPAPTAPLPSAGSRIVQPSFRKAVSLADVQYLICYMHGQAGPRHALPGLLIDFPVLLRPTQKDAVEDFTDQSKLDALGHEDIVTQVMETTGKMNDQQSAIHRELNLGCNVLSGPWNPWITFQTVSHTYSYQIWTTWPWLRR